MRKKNSVTMISDQEMSRKTMKRMIFSQVLQKIWKKTMRKKLSEEERLERFIEDIRPEINPDAVFSRKRQLTDEEKQLFTYFVAVPGMKEQLVDVLCDVQKGAAEQKLPRLEM